MFVQNSIKSMLTTATAQEKIQIIEQLNPCGLDDESLRNLISFISDPEKGVRNSITMQLMNCEDPRIPIYVTKYVSSADISTRNLAGEILVKLGDRSVNALLDYLKEVKTYDDQKFIIDLLGLIKSQVAQDPIIEILGKTSNENLKLSCIEALGNLKSEKAVDMIMQCYDEDELYKPTVNEALGKIGSKKALDFMISKYPNEDELTKYSIIESLAEIGNMETFFFLISELHKTSGPLTWVIIHSIRQLSERFGLEVPFDEKIRHAILNTIYEAQPEFKKAAISLLKEFNDKDILTACLTTLGDDFELDDILYTKVLENKEKAVLSFPNLLKMELTNAGNILRLVNDVIESLELPVQKILTGLNFRTFVDGLTSYLTHPDEESRRIAMNLLFKIDPNTAILFSDKMLSDDNLWNKLRLVDNLAQLNDRSALDILQKLSQDSEIMVSKRASELLKEMSSIYN